MEVVVFIGSVVIGVLSGDVGIGSVVVVEVMGAVDKGSEIGEL